MSDIYKDCKQHMDINESELPSNKIYEKLITKGVKCSTCDIDLSDHEIKMHRFVGIEEPEEMDCQICWASHAYEGHTLNF